MTPRIVLASAALCLVSSMPVFAVDAHHPEQAQDAPAASAPGGMKMDAKNLKAMQDNAAKMQDQLRRMGKAKTDDERGKLMAEHMKTLKENMMMAKGMQEGGCPMMQGMKDGKGGGMGMMDGKGGGMGMGMMHGGDGMGMGMMSGSGKGGDPADERIRRMERRMDMMEMMMMKSGKGGDMPSDMGKP